MKISKFGTVLFLTGSFSYLIISLYIAENPHIYNDKKGTFISLRETGLLTPYIIFCIIGIAGLAMNILEIVQQYIKATED